MENNTINELDQVDPNLRDEMLAELFLDQMINNFKKVRFLRELISP
ncbi:hypothetical protein MUB15_30880 [Priestia sp. OVS21]|nr:hypothetical protein [Priestia sp. OVS21]